MESKWEDQNNWVREISFGTIEKKKKRRRGDFLGGSVVKKLPANAGDAGSNPGLGRSPGEGNGYPRQYSCLEKPKRSLAGLHPWGPKRVGHDLATKQQ